MQLISAADRFRAMNIHGQAGFTAAAGFARCGHSRCGASATFGGVYTRVRTLHGWDTARRRYYRPTNPQTIPQQNWRGIFRAGVAAYHALSDAERMVYFKKSRKRGMTGYNLFLANWLQSRRG
jgi:hypothetical protein